MPPRAAVEVLPTSESELYRSGEMSPDFERDLRQDEMRPDLEQRQQP